MCIKWITNENLLYSTGNSYPCQSPKITTVNILEFIHSVIHIWHFFLARIVSVCSATYFFLNLTIMLEQLSKTLNTLLQHKLQSFTPVHCTHSLVLFNQPPLTEIFSLSVIFYCTRIFYNEICVA